MRACLLFLPHFGCSLASSLISGFAVTVAMNPADVVSTRMYNQPVVNGKGALYSSLFDCITKTARAEGVRGFYKGFVAHYLRLGPHTVVCVVRLLLLTLLPQLTFIVWEKVKRLASSFGL